MIYSEYILQGSLSGPLLFSVECNHNLDAWDAWLLRSVLNCVGCVGRVGWKSCVGRGSWVVGRG